MRIISGRSTVVYKKLLPFLGPPVALLALLLPSQLPRILQGTFHASAALVLLTLAVMFGFGYLLRRAFSNLMDEVEDMGDRLIVRYNGEEHAILMSNITSVDFPRSTGGPHSAPPVPRITLTLRQPCRFGREVMFISRIEPFSVSTRRVADELRERVKQASIE